MMNQTSALLAFLTLGLALIVLPAPQVTADCHPEDPLAQFECVYNDVDHAKEAYADALTGEAFATIAVVAACEDGRSIPWADWGADDDASCVPVDHAATSTHGSTAARVYPPDVDVRARVLKGDLWLDDQKVGGCVPALNVEDPSSCQDSIGVSGIEGCMTFRAVSFLNTGRSVEAAVTGPWTHC